MSDYPMRYTFTFPTIKTPIFFLFLLVALSPTTVRAQDYWDKIPGLTTQYYAEKDDFGNRIHLLKSDVKAKLEKSKQTVEEKANKMTNEERMAIATRLQNMSPDEIVKMQNEMMELTKIQAEFQQKSSEAETEFAQLESEFRAEFGKRLGPIEAEYNKLPDGEGTPQWAIKKGEELMTSYNKEYEAICDKYFTSATAKFRIWLKDFHAFLIQHEVPFNQKMLKSQYGQFGLTPDDSVSSLMAVERYLEKCASIAALRRPYPQG
jgi:TolA-binding protein